ncbi:MAG TPA: LacI family DNA-binding transcriptional regulator [Candidatus Sulfotelmatobacter sp.]|jgi:DNA-binding LacI/PurR family transcriptional regulator|nr:LacI family DNA-binding transcriptional regulator [Candidatus Sulfotelmatobacter sp.]
MKLQQTKRKKQKVQAVTLKAVAKRVGLTPGTVSAVLNNSAASRSVPEHTKKRVLSAARALNYRPNYLARSLRVKRTFMIGVIAEEIGDPYGSLIISGIERYLRKQNYFFLTVAHRHDNKLLETYSHLLLQRGVEGLISVDTSIREPQSVPTVAIAGHTRVRGVTNIVLDHRRAAQLALVHLVESGHRDIAFMKGSSFSSDAEPRWKAVCEVARELGLRMRRELIIYLEGDDPTPQLGYPFAKQLLARQQPFTALFAYNDISALGSIRAIQDSGLRVPEDISVIGFDDIQIAVHANPSLTTVRQPLQKMGEIAARTLIHQIEGREEYLPEILIEPEFVLRKSTAAAHLRTHEGAESNQALQ